MRLIDRPAVKPILIGPGSNLPKYTTPCRGSQLDGTFSVMDGLSAGMAD
jgi:hypothetical protein